MSFRLQNRIRIIIKGLQLNLSKSGIVVDGGQPEDVDQRAWRQDDRQPEFLEPIAQLSFQYRLLRIVIEANVFESPLFEHK